ncbi:MAG: hypothetical protein V1850_05890 [Candidatus Bathyarchaeota archaeon]
MDFFTPEIIVEIIVLAVIGIELFSLYWYFKFYHGTDKRIREAINRQCEKSDALIKVLDEHISKLDSHLSKLDGHMELYTDYMRKLDSHMATIEENIHSKKDES